MIRELQLRILPEQAASEQSIAAYVAREQSMDIRSIKSVRVLKRSIDARQRTVMVNLKVRVYIDEFPQDDEFPRIEYGDVSGKPRAIVVGAGPAGLFAALRLIELGICPVVVERGKNVHDRRKDIALISREQRVDPESNYSFGEGGAGAFSDGKLYTRSKKRGSVERILQIFCQHLQDIPLFPLFSLLLFFYTYFCNYLPHSPQKRFVQLRKLLYHIYFPVHQVTCPY